MSSLIKASALAALSLFLFNLPLQAEEPKMTDKSTKSSKADCKGKANITNADGKDGENNSGPNSGNGAKGGTIKNPCKASGNVSANGGNGGSNNKGGNSGNGGKGGTIEF